MKFPTLRHALLCRILPYALIIFLYVAPPVLAGVTLGAEAAAVVFILGSVGILAYLFRFFVPLMMMDAILGNLRSYEKARSVYTLRGTGEALKKRIERRIMRFGRAVEPYAHTLKPDLFRYRAKTAMTVYHSGIDYMLLSYSVELLNEDTYTSVMHSAQSNFARYIGHRKTVLLDRAQKKAPRSRAAVAVIFAERIDGSFSGERLLNRVLKSTRRANEDEAFVPLVIDLGTGKCVYDGLRDVYAGFAYPAMNRANNLIEKYVFGGRKPWRGNTEYRSDAPTEHIDKTLWELWGEMNRTMQGGLSRKERKLLASLADFEAAEYEECVYCKCGKQSVRLLTEPDAAGGIAVEDVRSWEFPKANLMSSAHRKKVRRCITEYYAAKGLPVTFKNFEEEPDEDL